MRIASRGLLLGVAALIFSSAAFAASPRTNRAAGRERRGRAGRVTLVNYDLEGKAAQQLDLKRLRALLMYVTPESAPDVIAFHSMRRSFAEGQRRSQLAQLATSVGMYYAFQPTAEAVGSALLSRFPLKNIAGLSTAAGAPIGMKAEVQVQQRTITALLVRPPSAAATQAAVEAVAKAVRDQPKALAVVFASFGPGAKPAEALSAWAKAGLVDAATAAKQGATLSYPSAEPVERLDFIFVSPGLGDQVAAYRVARERRLVGVSDHLPVAAVLRR